MGSSQCRAGESPGTVKLALELVLSSSERISCQSLGNCKASDVKRSNGNMMVRMVQYMLERRVGRMLAGVTMSTLMGQRWSVVVGKY